MLGFVEAVDFIDKQNGGSALLEGDFGFVDGFADVFHAGKYGGYGQELGVEALCENAGEGGFAHAGRPPQQHGVWLPAFHGHAQGLARADQVLLADYVVERVRAQAFGQGGGGGLGEEVVGHGGLPEKW